MTIKRFAELVDLSESEHPEAYMSPEVVAAAESIDWESPQTSFRDVRKWAIRNYRKLKEAQPSSAFGQLLRAGIQTIANGAYQRTEVNWNKVIVETSSDKRQEFYAPLYGSALPTRTGPGEPYSESRVQGLDREVINYKYMGGESFQRELFDDDQTGQVRQRASKLGEAMKVLEEVYVAGRIHGTATTIAGVAIPASTYSTVNANGSTISTPFSTTLYSASAGNRPSSYGQLSVPALKTAYEALMNAVDPLNIKMLIDPKLLLVSTFDAMNAKTIANSAYYPGVPGLSGQTASSAGSGFASGSFAENPMKGMFEVVINRYLPRGAWYLLDKSPGAMVFQRRDPMEVVQEQPQSGQSFDMDVYRFRSRSRWETEWLDSRFWYEGNDGTATVSQ